MKRLWTACLVLLITVVMAEAVAMVAVKAGTYLAYGQFVEVVKVRYDPYIVFQPARGQTPTAHSRFLPQVERNRQIWMFGGSTMVYSTNNLPEESIASLLARRCNEAAPDRGHVVENFGVASFSSLLEVQYLQKSLIEKPIPPDLVVFYDGVNDANTFFTHGGPNGHHGVDRLRGVVESAGDWRLSFLSPLVGAWRNSHLLELTRKLTAVARPVDAADPLLAEHVRQVEARYDEVWRTAVSRGVPFLLFWQPTRWVEREEEEGRLPEAVRQAERPRFNEATVATFRHNYRTLSAALTARLRDKPYFVDVRAALATRTVPAYKEDGVHLLTEGNELVAAALQGPVLTTLADAEARHAATRLADWLEPASQEAVTGLEAPREEGGVRSRRVQATGGSNAPPALLRATSPMALSARLDLALHVQGGTRNVTLRWNGRPLDHLVLERDGLHVRRYPLAVETGENVLELALGEGAGVVDLVRGELGGR